MTQKYDSISKDVREQLKWLAYSLQKIEKIVREKMTSFLTKTKGID